MTDIERLARRVRWLEQKRRSIRVGVVIVGAALGFVFLPDMLGGDWPQFHARATAIALAFILAFVVDVGIVGAMSVWEVRHDRLARDRGLPRATLRK